jgi:hypothetical protein
VATETLGVWLAKMSEDAIAISSSTAAILSPAQRALLCTSQAGKSSAKTTPITCGRSTPLKAVANARRGVRTWPGRASGDSSLTASAKAPVAWRYWLRSCGASSSSSLSERSLARSIKFIGAGCLLGRTANKRTAPGVGRGRLRYTPHLQKVPGGWQRALTTKNSMSPLAWRSPRNLWKTRTTRNFPGFPGFRHIPGIGRCCIVRVPAERVSHSVVVRKDGRKRATWPRPNRGFFFSSSSQGYGK